MSKNNSPNRQNLYRWLYLSFLIAVIVWNFLYPPWVGRMYYQGFSESGKWNRSGSFGIDRRRAPIWNPPKAAGRGIAFSVRYPWEQISSPNSVEINMGVITLRISFAVFLLGPIFGGIHHFKKSSTPDLVLQIAWALSLTLLIAFPGLFLIAILSSGYGPPNSISVLVILLAYGLGFFIGFMSYRKQRSQESDSLEEIELQEVPSKSDPGFGRRLLWFAVGIVSTFLITFIALLIASNFRGPVGGFTVLGTVHYVKDQTPINMATGLGILITGHALAFLFISRWKLKSLAWGLIIGSILAGLAVAFAK